MKLLALFLFLCIVFMPLPVMPSSRHVFGMFGVNVTSDLAEWSRQMGFTDILARYQSNETATCNLIQSVGLRFWGYRYLSTTGISTTSLTYWEQYVQSQVASCASDRVMFDDFQVSLGTATVNASLILDAVRSCEHDGNIILIFSMCSTSDTQLIGSLNLTGIPLLVYHLPTNLLSQQQLAAIHAANPSMLIDVLWCWNGPDSWVYPNGTDWTKITSIQLNAFYTDAIQNHYAGIFIFTLLENDTYEVGMSNASLLNFPHWWTIIRIWNELYRRGGMSVRTGSIGSS